MADLVVVVDDSTFTLPPQVRSRIVEEHDARYPRTVNGAGPDEDGNIAVAAGAASWDDLDKPPVIAAGDTAAEARAEIGAGTSSLAVGTTASSAKAGNWTPGLADIPAGSVIQVMWSGSAWGARPTARTDVAVWWVGGPQASRPAEFVDAIDVHWPDS